MRRCQHAINNQGCGETQMRSRRRALYEIYLPPKAAVLEEMLGRSWEQPVKLKRHNDYLWTCPREDWAF